MSSVRHLVDQWGWPHGLALASLMWPMTNSVTWVWWYLHSAPTKPESLARTPDEICLRAKRLITFKTPKLNANPDSCWRMWRGARSLLLPVVTAKSSNTSFLLCWLLLICQPGTHSLVIERTEIACFSPFWSHCCTLQKKECHCMRWEWWRWFVLGSTV